MHWIWISSLFTVSSELVPLFIRFLFSRFAHLPKQSYRHWDDWIDFSNHQVICAPMNRYRVLFQPDVPPIWWGIVYETFRLRKPRFFVGRSWFLTRLMDVQIALVAPLKTFEPARVVVIFLDQLQRTYQPRGDSLWDIDKRSQTFLWLGH